VLRDTPAVARAADAKRTLSTTNGVRWMRSREIPRLATNTAALVEGTSTASPVRKIAGTTRAFVDLFRRRDRDEPIARGSRDVASVVHTSAAPDDLAATAAIQKEIKRYP
jgi:hypothetical protein